MQLKHARYLTFTLAACAVASNSLYLYYLMQHSMLRWWSGINGLLLGFFMLSWSAMPLSAATFSPSVGALLDPGLPKAGASCRLSSSISANFLS